MMEHEQAKQRDSRQSIAKKTVSSRPCANCDSSHQHARELGFKLDQIEKELFAVKSEKMQAVLDQRLAEERLKLMAKE